MFLSCALSSNGRLRTKNRRPFVTASKNKRHNLVYLTPSPAKPCPSPDASKIPKAFTSSPSQRYNGGAAHAVDVFTRSVYVDILLDSLRYCQKEKGLRIHAWCVMSNHVHLMISTEFGNHPSDALRDLKNFTSKKIEAAIVDTEQPESRRSCMLWLFKQAGENNSKNKVYQFWQQENHPPIELISNKFIDQKLEYIHMNPVKAGLVDEPWEYRYPSVRDYMNNQKGLLGVELI